VQLARPSQGFRLPAAAWLAVACGQVAFVGHDAGHQQIFRTRRPNHLVGLAHANLLLGVSYGWWVGKHNRHTATPSTRIETPTSTSARRLHHQPGACQTGAGQGNGPPSGLPILPDAAGGGGAPTRRQRQALLGSTVRHKRMEALLLLAHLAG
jgi:fatty acid desaturase